MTTRNRTQLKAFFVKNAIPTESNFADLIDSALNQSEDGIFKSPSDSLAIVAAGDSKRVLRLFGAPPPAAADWQLSLNPPQTAATPQSSRAGLGVSDGAGNLRLFLDAATGNLGVGTNKPDAPLDVRVPGAVANADRLLVDATAAWDGVSKHVTLATANAGQLNLHNPHVPWLGLENRASIRFGRSGGVIGGNFWDVGARAGNAFSISLNSGNDPKLTVLASGNVGVGTSAPAQRLDVAGNANITGSVTVTGSLTAAGLISSSPIATTALHASGSVNAASLTVPNATIGALTVTSGVTVATITANNNITTPNLSAAAITSSSVTVSNQLTAGGVVAGALVTAKAGVVLTGGSLTAAAATLGAAPRRGLYLDTAASLTHARMPQFAGDLVSGGFTIQAWVYLYSLKNSAILLDLGNANPRSDSIVVYVSEDGRLGCTLYDNQVPIGFATNAGAVQTRRWTHVAVVTAPNGSTSLVVNGVTLINFGAKVPRNVLRTVNTVGITSQGPTPIMSGHIAELSLWRGPCPVVQTPLTLQEPNLVGYWPLADNLLNALPSSPIGSLLSADPFIQPRFGSGFEPTQALAIHDEAWIPLGVSQGWGPNHPNHAPVSYHRDASGYVHLRGVLTGPGVGTINNTSPFTEVLPPGYRPQYQTLLTSQSAGGVARIDVTHNGSIVIIVGHQSWTSFDGLSFRAFA